MILGRVIGEVWATRRHAGLSGRKLLVIAPQCWYDPPFQVGHLVAVDPVGAGVGEDVVVCMGDPARRILTLPPDGSGSDIYAEAAAPNLPVDASVMAIVDRVEIAAAAEQRARRE